MSRVKISTSSLRLGMMTRLGDRLRADLGDDAADPAARLPGLQAGDDQTR